MPHVNLAEVESWDEFCERRRREEPGFCYQSDQDRNYSHHDDNMLADWVLEPDCLQWGLDFNN